MQQQMAQGLGEGPAEVLAGAEDGTSASWSARSGPIPSAGAWSDRLYDDVNVNGMAVTDQVVVAGYES